MYVYLNSEPGLYTVGHYDPKGNWIAESDHNSSGDAAMRVHYLNGGRESIRDVAKRVGMKVTESSAELDSLTGKRLNNEE